MAERIYKGDTATIEANLFDEDGVNFLPANEVNWSVRAPDGVVTDYGPDTVTETNAEILFNDTTQPGQYAAQITFDLPGGSKRSVVLSFEVIDPLETTTESDNPVDATVDRAWMKLEDLFDSELGGPHMRDRTLAMFDREKMKRFLPDAYYGIGNTYQPAMSFDDTSFPFEQHMPLLSQALLVESLYHLMRTYVEQPQPMNSNVPYFDRRDYLNRWQLVLDKEEQKLIKWLDLFKMEQMGFGSTSILVGGYASYPVRYPRYMRGKYPYIYRW